MAAVFAQSLSALGRLGALQQPILGDQRSLAQLLLHQLGQQRWHSLRALGGGGGGAARRSPGSAAIRQPSWQQARWATGSSLSPRVPASAAKASEGLQPLHLDQLSALVDRLRGEAPKEAVDWMEDTLAVMKQDQIDGAALLKRSWSDAPFEEGEAGNDRTIEGFERELVGMLRKSSRGLADGEASHENFPKPVPPPYDLPFTKGSLPYSYVPFTSHDIGISKLEPTVLALATATHQVLGNAIDLAGACPQSGRARCLSACATCAMCVRRVRHVRELGAAPAIADGVRMWAAETLPGQVMEAPDHDLTGESKNCPTELLNESVRSWFDEQNGSTLEGALAFVPFILQQAYYEGNLDEKQIVIHHGEGGVVFSDASGFTALTEKLAKKSNGAELLSQCLTAFFTPLIDLINAYRGDTIKFSGDALTIYFPSVDDSNKELCPLYNHTVPAHGSYDIPELSLALSRIRYMHMKASIKFASACDGNFLHGSHAALGPMATAVLRASACCIEIHKRLHMFETGVDDVRLCLHIGVGCGEIRILQVGGIVPPETHIPRIEYLISGAPLEQISIAEPLAKNGETCLSPDAWELVKDCVIEGRPLEDRPDFHLLLRMDESCYTFPTIKYATQLYDTRHEKCFKLKELNITRRYIPSAVFKQIECGTLNYVNEMRKVSVIFINGSGLDVMSEKGPRLAQELMSSVQKICYAHEGTLNKFLIDDKGMLFLLVFGLPPLVHPDDPTRAVLATMELTQVFKRMDLIGRFGVTTGRSYCGVCGSAKRMEYTVLGDCVNLSARLMSNAPPLGVLTDEETSKHSTGEVLFKALAPIKVKGKSNAINIFKPSLRESTGQIGLTVERKIRFPWYDNPIDGSDVRAKDPVADCKKKVQNLCSISKWSAMAKVSEMLGSPANKALSEQDPIIATNAPRIKAPANSPFADGGVVVMEGPTGVGRMELGEHIITHCATQCFP
ncbi:unnamed protein product [Polarella glacialis]|uniref:Guanylate cyclase domain-containing protein n=1 Tax=Polarella glacialis TaxID=89957 RepID=A0A813HQF1_POLGL|nr:unnamed protein product [Polarella glacialis]